MKVVTLYVGLFVIYCEFKTSLSIYGRNEQINDNSGNTTCKGPEACVFEEIFAGYNRLVRPVKDYNDVIVVHLQMVANGLLDIEEKDEFMRMVGFFRAYWSDQLLTWDPSQHSNVTEIVVPAQQIWIPDIGITNSVSNFYEITYKRDFHLKIDYQGHIRWSFGGILTTSCDIDLTYYPFDEQECDLELESWQYEAHKVRLLPLEDTPVNLDTLGDDPQWILQNATGDNYLKYDGKYSTVVFSLHWVRKPLYFYVNIIVPCVYMAIITLGVFWLPIECGEKMSLGITVVLAFSVFQIVIMDITPVSSDAVPKITELVVTVMSLATVSLLTSMFISYLGDHANPPPLWLKKVFLYYFPKAARMSFHKLYEEELFGKKPTPILPKKQLKDKDVYKKHFINDEEHGTSPQNATNLNGREHTIHKQEVLTEPTTTQQTSPKKTTQHLSMRQSNKTRSEESVLVKDVQEILRQLEHMKKRVADEEQNQKIKEDWKYIGRAIDRLVFWICLVVLITYVLYAYFKIRFAS